MELLKQLEPVGLEKKLLHSDGFLSKSLVQIDHSNVTVNTATVPEELQARPLT